MKFLVINEKFQYGGTEVQSKREIKNLLKHGHKACFLTFDDNYPSGYIEEYCFNISKPESSISTFLHECVMDNDIYLRVVDFLNDYNPDFIHLNNTDKHALAIFKAIQRFPCFQTVRDYSVVCPMGLSICSNLQVCDGYRSVTTCCQRCLKHQKNKVKILLKIGRFKIRTAARRKYIKNYACPSQMLTDYCNQYGLPTECINNPFDFELLDSMCLVKEDVWQDKIFLYYGEIVGHKGISQIIKAFSEFAQGKTDVQLHLAGKVNPQYENEFRQLLKDYQWAPIRYLGKLQYTDIIKKLMNVHTVVVPSLWIENYPNTALEAVSCGCLVLGSERGGMREIIGDDQYIFKILEKDDIVAKLQFAYDHSEETYRNVTMARQKHVRENNSLEMYYNRLIDKVNKIALG